jgi:DNA polymerase elongation subunit (family B)
MKFYTNVFQRGNKIYVRGYNNDKRFAETIDYKPYLFINSSGKNNTKYRTLDDKLVDRRDFDTIKDAKNFVEQFNNVDNVSIYGLTNYQYVYIYDTFESSFDYDVNLINIISLDIETDSSGGFPDIEAADKEITAITISRKGEKMVFGFFPYTPEDEKVTYILCKDEYELLSKFLKVWNTGRFMPDVLTGWNIDFFDVPYLVNRITLILGKNEAKNLSPWGILDERTVITHGKEMTVFIPAGINVLDYLHLYKKFSFKNESSYKLDDIAEGVLGVKKLDYSEYKSLDELYRKDYHKFITYNIHDTTLIDMLEEKLKFIEQVIAFAYDARVNYNDTFATVKPWDVIIHNYLMDMGRVVPMFVKKDMDEALIGGYVKEPKIGMNKWIVSFDANSLYPHLIMQYGISPDTLIGQIENFHSIDGLLAGRFDMDKDPNISYAANGTMYRKDKQGFLSALMEKMYNDRVLYKNKMTEAKKKLQTLEKGTVEYRKTTNDIAKFHNLQLAKKIQLNSAYGALANVYFRWFDFRLAEAITMSGQLSIRWAERNINAYMNRLLKTKDVDYVVAIDTDSVYVNFEPLINSIGLTDIDKCVDVIDKFCEEKIQKVFDNAFNDLYVYMNAQKQKMFMKRETIADKAIWKAKKMYIMNARDIEGVRFKKPEVKMQGIEAVRSSTPKPCRNSIKRALEIIMNEDETATQDYIAQFKREFMKMPFESVAFPRGVNGMTKYFDASSIYGFKTPIHVKGALIYNNMIKKKGLENDYQMVTDGDKIKFAYLKMPNPTHDTVISVPDILPPEFNLQKYIDYDLQFEKSFLEPIKNILDVIGWSTEKRSTLEDFFS